MWFTPKSDFAQSRLEERLRGLQALSVSSEKIEKMKRVVMNSRTSQKVSETKVSEDFAFHCVAERVKELSREIMPREYFRVLLREKLITLLQAQYRGAFPLPRFLRLRKLFAVGLAFVFVFTIVFQFGFGIDRVEASYVTVLDEAVGDVNVFREGREIQVTMGLLLVGEDIVRTGAGSKAAIRFLDQSLTRLDENTEVKISKLFINPGNKSQTIVELILHRGRVWARVINLVDDLSRFQVKANNTVAVAKKKAAFEVELPKNNKAKISAIQHRVELVVATKREVVETTLVKGFSAEIPNVGSMKPLIQADKPQELPEQWVTDNLAKDEVYIAALVEEEKQQRQDQVQVLPGNPLYAVKEFSQSTKIVFEGDEFEKQKKMASIAATKLLAAEVLLEKGDIEGSAVLLGEFNQSIVNVGQWLKDQEAANPARVLELKTHIEELLSAYEKQLAVVLPTDRIYPIKEALAQSHVAIASGPAEKAEATLSIASDKLLEAQDLVESGDEEGAAAQVKEYTLATEDIVTDAKQLPTDQQEKAVNAILDTKLKDLKVLEAIVAAPKLPEVPMSVEVLPVLPSVDSPSPSESQTPVEVGDKKDEIEIKPVQEDAPAESREDAEPRTETQVGDPAVQAQEPVPSAQPPAVLHAQSTELERTVSDAKNEALTQIGEAVLEVQRNQPSVESIQKIKDLKDADINGKPLIDLKVTRKNVTIKTDGTVISIPPKPLQKEGSKIPELLPVLP